MNVAPTQGQTGNRPCIFCSIAKGEVESHTVFRDEYSIAFLDFKPLFPGHSLLIPVQHYETLSDLPSELVRPLFTNAQFIGGCRKGNECRRFLRCDQQQDKPECATPPHSHNSPQREGWIARFFLAAAEIPEHTAILDVQRALQTAIKELQSMQ